MKRFLIIFAICFASVIGVIGGVFGIKYLKGDFKRMTEIIRLGFEAIGAEVLESKEE